MTPEGVDGLVEISKEILVDQGLGSKEDWKEYYPCRDLDKIKSKLGEDGRNIDNKAFGNPIDYGIIPGVEGSNYLILMSYQEENGSRTLALIENGFNYYTEDEQRKEAKRWKKKSGINIGNLLLGEFKAL